MPLLHTPLATLYAIFTPYISAAIDAATRARHAMTLHGLRFVKKADATATYAIAIDSWLRQKSGDG